MVNQIPVLSLGFSEVRRYIGFESPPFSFARRYKAIIPALKRTVSRNTVLYGLHTLSEIARYAEVILLSFTTLSYGGSRATTFHWYAHFTDGKKNMEDEERSGRPVSTKTDENIAPVADVLKTDRRYSCRLIEEKIEISKTIIQRILREDLKKRKVRAFCAAFFKCRTKGRKAHVQDLLEIIANDPDFLDSIITNGESWCFVYDPETKSQSAE